MEPLYPPWQTVEEAEQGDRRVSNLSTVSAEDAKLIMKRCRQLKRAELGQMDQLYKAKVSPCVFGGGKGFPCQRTRIPLSLAYVLGDA